MFMGHHPSFHDSNTCCNKKTLGLQPSNLFALSDISMMHQPYKYVWWKRDRGRDRKRERDQERARGREGKGEREGLKEREIDRETTTKQASKTQGASITSVCNSSSMYYVFIFIIIITIRNKNSWYAFGMIFYSCLIVLLLCIKFFATNNNRFDLYYQCTIKFKFGFAT